jgi:hypothetical protein
MGQREDEKKGRSYLDFACTRLEIKKDEQPLETRF